MSSRWKKNKKWTTECKKYTWEKTIKPNFCYHKKEIKKYYLYVCLSPEHSVVLSVYVPLLPPSSSSYHKNQSHLPIHSIHCAFLSPMCANLSVRIRSHWWYQYMSECNIVASYFHLKLIIKFSKYCQMGETTHNRFFWFIKIFLAKLTQFAFAYSSDFFPHVYTDVCNSLLACCQYPFERQI